MDLLRDLDRRIAYGVVGGTFAGLLFLLANMWYADNQGLPAVAPLYDISTIFYFTDKPDPQPINAAVGLVVHLTLSAAFGAALAALAPLARGAGRLMGMGAAFGLVLYLVNFQILGRVAFEWFQEGPNQTFEVFAHLGYGLLVAPFLVRFASTTAEQHAASHASAARPAAT
jgi:type IV secretory pathway TrbD component